MRQLFLVVVLVAAAFLGGAFVNGPGLQWAQTRLLRSLGLNNGGEIASIKLESVANPELESKPPVDPSLPIIPLASISEGPTAPVPSVQIDAKSPKHVVSGQSTSSQTRPNSIPGAPASSALSIPTTTFEGSKALKIPANRSLTRSDNTVTPASGRALPDPTITGAPLKGDAGPAILDTLAALLPTDSPASPSPAALPSTILNSKSHMSGADSWMILEHKMQSLGVVRYSVDGEPGGHVVFSCLIPVAGRKAVTQRFEAEGEDVVHATQAALRRIALWRATQPTTP